MTHTSPTLLSVAPYVRITLAAAVTGYTPKAIERKIEEGVWLEGEVWIKAPDGSRLISIEGYKKWAESGWRQK
jgi:hypothetical protein